MNQPKPNFLNKSEKNSLEALQRQSRDKRISDRIRVILLLDRGWPYKKIAAALFLDIGTVRRYYAIYQEEGKDTLIHLKYSGSSCELNDEQQKKLREYVKENVPTTVTPVVEYIRNHFSVEYSESSVVVLLHRLGFVYKKPSLVPGKADSEKQKEFLKELEELENSLGADDKVIYMDGVHPQHNSKPAYGWMEKGEETVLKANSGRQRININGALDSDTLDVTINISDSVNAQSTIELFQKLEERYPNAKRIVIICDNARYYRSKFVREYIDNSRIELKFLPPYSPNLNLIERLWRFMNKKVRDNKYYEKFSDFKRSVLEFFGNLSSHKKALSSLLVKKFHIIKM